MRLPIEIQEKILQNLMFEQVIRLSNYVAKKLHNPKIHTWNYAAMNGHLEVVKWLHEFRSEGCTKDAINLAACNGHLEVMKWLHENRTEGRTKWAMSYAASNGHLEIVKWLHENKYEGCTQAMDYATRNDHLEIVEYLQSIQ